jgi:hypothetical protein
MVQSLFSGVSVSVTLLIEVFEHDGPDEGRVAVRLGERRSCHRFLANDSRRRLHAAATDLLVHLRSVVPDPIRRL